MKILIIKLAGETGLRRPGSVMEVSKATAEAWIKRGFARKFSDSRPRIKEEKAEPETKELKAKPETKAKKPQTKKTTKKNKQ
jgi:hypothetical protein